MGLPKKWELGGYRISRQKERVPDQAKKEGTISTEKKRGYSTDRVLVRDPTELRKFPQKVEMGHLLEK